MVAVTTAEGPRERFNAGERFKFLHFWGHTPPRDGTVSRSCFSQWFDAPFEVEGARFLTAEHFMMAEKARLFGDESVYQRVLVAANPGAAKALGRQVAGFSEDLWLEHRSRIVFQAMLGFALMSVRDALRGAPVQQ